MRHRVDGYKLGRLTQHRWAMFRNLLVGLFRHERIETTEAKAKAMRGLADHVITLAKRENLHARRQVLSLVPDPFALRELMSRIRALLRRAYGDLANAAGGRVIRHGDLVIDLERRRVQRGTRRIALTATEFEILRHLASRPGRVFSRRELLELFRDYEALDQDEKTINVHVSHLRDKIEDDPSLPQFVLTVRGAGYQFAEL